ARRAHDAGAGAGGRQGRARRRCPRRRAARPLRSTASAGAGSPPRLGSRPRRRAVDVLPVAPLLRRPGGRLVDHAPPRRARAAGGAGRPLWPRRVGARPPLAHSDRRPPRPRVRTPGGEGAGVSDLAEQITRLWDGRDDLAAVMPPAEARTVVHEAIELLDRGEARVAEVVDGEVVVHEWLKQAILLLFRLE